MAINLTIGQNGIFTRAGDAVVKNENASVYEKLQMVVAGYEIDEAGKTNEETKLKRLNTDGYIDEENIVIVENLMGSKMQTGKGSIEEGDVYILEQRQKTASSITSDTTSDLDYYLIYYDDENVDRNLGLAFENENNSIDSNVKITISKEPETEPTGIVYLEVEKVEGINSTININEIDITELDEETKFLLALIMELTGEYNMNYKNFNQMINNNFTDQGEYFAIIMEDVDNFIQEEMEFLKRQGIETITSYIIGNPENEVSDYYRTNKNGKYTFKVADIFTRKTYEQTIDVDNIDESMPAYYVEDLGGRVVLSDINNNRIEFEEAYIIYEGERIDVMDCIYNDGRGDCIDCLNVNRKFFGSSGIENSLYGTTQTFEIVKDGNSYLGDVVMVWIL